jgi:hypothetical protein
MMTEHAGPTITRNTYSHQNLFISLLGLVLLVASTEVLATYPDITGSWSGTATGTDTGCSNPADNGTFTDSITVTFSNQQIDGNFDVSIFIVEEDGTTETDTGTGFFLSPTDIEFTVINSGVFGTDITTVNSTISAGTTQSFTFSGSNSGGDLCAWSGSGSVTRSGGGADVVVTPEITPSSTITSVIDFTSQIQAVTSDLGARIQNVMHGLGRGPRLTANGLMLEGQSGLNAGDGAISYGAWVSYSYSDFDNDLSSTAFDGDRHSVLGGFDFAPWQSMVIGIAVGYEDSDIDTTFNLGELETDGYTIAPYFGYLFTDTWSVNFSFGYSNVDYDQFRTAPGTTTRITSSTDADRWFGMFNLNGVTTYGNWILGGRVGTLWARNEVDAFVESDGTAVAEVRSKLGTWSIGGDAAYSFGAFEPFVSATYEHDYSLTEIAVTTGPQPDNDRDDVLFGAGVRYFGGKGISGNLDWTRRLGRSDYDEDIFTASIRVDF